MALTVICRSWMSTRTSSTAYPAADRFDRLVSQRVCNARLVGTEMGSIAVWVGRGVANTVRELERPEYGGFGDSDLQPNDKEVGTLALAACPGCGFVRTEWVLWPRDRQLPPCPDCGQEMGWMGVAEARKQANARLAAADRQKRPEDQAPSP